MSDDFPELTQDQFATLYTNGQVNHTVQGQDMPLTMESDSLSLTEAQAELLVHALSKIDSEVYVTAETARRTQEILRQRFSLDEEDGSYFEFDQDSI